MINKLVHIAVEMATLGILYREAYNNRHANIARRPRNELVKHERGRDDTETENKWHSVETEPAYYHIRWMAEISTRREQLVRMIREQAAEVEKGVNDSLGGS